MVSNHARLAPRDQFLAIVGLALAFGFVWLASLLPGGNFPQRILLSIVFQWLTAAVVAIIALRLLAFTPSELGLRPPRPLDWPIALVTLILSLVVAGIVNSAFPPPEAARAASEKLFGLPVFNRLVLVITAGVCEEFLFRGFAITALARLVGNRWLAALLSLIAFTLAHAGLFGWTTALLVPCVLGLILTLLYVFRGNLFIPMLVHAAIDAIGLLLGPALRHAA
jgi:uncharacterized protein